MKGYPFVSFVIPCYNSEILLPRLLKSIVDQDYPREKMEIIAADGGSSDSTLEILKKYKVVIVHNKKQFPEGFGMGKAQGIEKAKGEFVVVVDSDNELQGKDWLKQSLDPLLQCPDAFGAACIMQVRPTDTLINRYLSFIGTDPFAVYRSFEAKYAFGFLKRAQDFGNYYLYTIGDKEFLCTGGNCFIYRKKCLDLIGGYSYDVENVLSLVCKGWKRFVIPKYARTHHLSVLSFGAFLRKRINWSLNYSKGSRPHRLYSWLPQRPFEYVFIPLFIFSNLILVPQILVAFFMIIKKKDSAWIWHPLASFAITVLYVLLGLRSLFFRTFTSL